MNWGGIQVERTRFFSAYRSVPMVVVRLLATLTLVSCLLVLLSQLVFEVPNTLIGFALILLGPSLAICSFHLYATSIWADPAFLIRQPSKWPLDNFDYMAVEALLTYKKTGKRSAFWARLAADPYVSALMYRLGLTDTQLEQFYPSADSGAESLVQAVLEQTNQKRQFDAIDLVAVGLSEPVMGQYLSSVKLPSTAVSALIDYYGSVYRRTRTQRFWQVWQRRSGGFAKLWSTSYTTVLDRFTADVGTVVIDRRVWMPLVGRQAAVEQIVTELNKRDGQNVLIVGEPGIGKTEVFYELAARVIGFETKTALDGMQVRILDLPALMAAAPSQTDLAPLFEALFRDLSRAGNVILYIASMELLLSDDEAGSVDAANLLGQYLSDSRIRIIGSITPESHITLVRSKPALAEQFGSVNISAPAGAELERILLAQLPAIEARYQSFFLLTALERLIELSGRYVKDQASPEREIRLMEEVAAHAHKSGGVVTVADVTAVIEQRSQVKLQVDETEQETLLNLEAQLHERVIGQNRAIKLVSDALLRARAGLSKSTKPIGSFLFLGPTGVGKTETAKALSDIYFGSAKNLIRLDMSEYADANGLEKLLGRDPVKQPGALTVAIQQAPSAVVLFDEIEKASQSVRNLMLQLLDEGRLTTNFGKVLDFTNSIIIATSNAGSDFIKTSVEQRVAANTIEKQLLDRLISERIFAPEYLNRFDGVVVYLPLTMAEIKEVVKLQLTSLAGLVQKEKGVALSVSDSVVTELAKRGYDPVFGARALQRVMKDQLETAIAKQIIATKPAPGSKLVIESL